MILPEAWFLADENIHPEIVAYLISKGFDVTTVKEHGLRGRSDEEVLEFAHEQNRVVLTHDSDFGALVVAGGKPFTGIVYLKPGHILPGFTVQSLESLFAHVDEVSERFIIVVQQKPGSIRIRMRQL